MARPKRDEKATTETIGDRVKIIRRSMGMKQSEFSELLGIRQPLLSQIENNQVVVNVEIIAKLCKMGYPADWLIEGKQSQAFNWEQLMRVFDKMGIPREDPYGQGIGEILNLMRGLTPDQLSYIKGIVVGLNEANRAQKLKEGKTK